MRAWVGEVGGTNLYILLSARSRRRVGGTRAVEEDSGSGRSKRRWEGGEPREGGGMTMPHMAKKLTVVPYVLWCLLSSRVSSPFPTLCVRPLFRNRRLIILLILPPHLFPPDAPDYKQISLRGSSVYGLKSDDCPETTPLVYGPSWSLHPN